MRMSLSNSMRTRPGDNTKDARNTNGYVDGADNKQLVRKRAGTSASAYTYATPQAFSYITDFTIALEYGAYPNIGMLLFAVNGDSWSIADLTTGLP